MLLPDYYNSEIAVNRIVNNLEMAVIRTISKGRSSEKFLYDKQYSYIKKCILMIFNII